MKIKFDWLCNQGIRIIFLFFAWIILSLCTLNFTYRANEGNSIVEKPGNTVAYILYLLIFIVMICLVWFLVCRLKSKENKIVSILLFGCALTFSFILANSFDTMPSSDQIAMYFSTNDAVHGWAHALDVGGYINMHAHQVGLFSFLYLPVKFFQEHWNYYYMLHALMIQTALYMVYASVKRIYSEPIALFTYIVFLMFVPVYFLEFVFYGEPYLVFVMACSLLIYSYEFKYSDYFCAFLFGVSAMLRSNAVVLIIAFLIIKGIEIIKTKKYLLFVKCVLCLLLYLFPVRFNTAIVENAYNVEIGDYSMPFENYIAIGLGVSQMVGEPGTYDQRGYNYLVDSDYDKEYVKEMSLERITESLEMMKQESYRQWFFERKMIITWTDPDYECMNYVFPNLEIPEEEFYKPDDNLISGLAPDETKPVNMLGELITKYFHKIRIVERIYTNAIYILAIIAALLMGCKNNEKKDKLSRFLQLSFFGNVMLYLIIEAKPRYILIPFMLLILYVGCNVGDILSKVNFSKFTKQ